MTNKKPPDTPPGKTPFQESMAMIGKMAGTALSAKAGQKLAGATYQRLNQSKLGQIHPALPAASTAALNLGLTAASVAVSRSGAPALIKTLAQFGMATGASGAVVSAIATGGHILTAGVPGIQQLAGKAKEGWANRGPQAQPQTGQPGSDQKYRNVTPPGSPQNPAGTEGTGQGG